MTGHDLALLARSAVHLQPEQVAHRARLRAQRTALRYWPQAGRALLAGRRLLAGRGAAAAAGWPAGFVPVDGRASLGWPGRAELACGRIELLGMTRELGDPPDWQQGGAPQLWRFHLHYWDWAWGMAGDPDLPAARAVFARLWRSWQAAAGFGRGDAWLPYPAAVRAWSWCGVYRDLVAGSDLESWFVGELAVHAGFLRWHLESDVGGNHLIKNLKALAGLAVFFADSQLLGRALRALLRQLAVQVLPDGGHYERAPAYHCQVLADLIDVAELLRAAGAAPVPQLTTSIRRMRGWLGAVVSPAGAVPLLNDGYPVPAGLIGALRPEPPAARTLLILPGTGLVRATAGGWHLLSDVGAPCPEQLPAHAHADTFGCEVHVDGMALLVDTGTSTYAPGAVRQYERSTAAHNTLEVDGCDSTEVWSAFRAGRRARVTGFTASAAANAVTFEAAHDGFRRLRGRPAHRRRWSLKSSGLEVDDLVTGTGRHAIIVRWHLAPGAVLRLEAGGAVATTRAGAFRVSITAWRGAAPCVPAPCGAAPCGPAPCVPCVPELSVEPMPVADGFGRTTVAPVLACRLNAVLPVRVTTCWGRARDERLTGDAEGTP